MAPVEKTPIQAEKERQQKEWERVAKEALDVLVKEIPKIDSEDVDTRASLYRQLLGIRDKVAQCDVSTRKSYNVAVRSLYSSMDAMPSMMFLPEEDPRP